MDKLIFIVGPTGVGKSKIAVKLAKKYNGEIISGDAFQIYNELNIGSAKISKDEMQGIKHYMINELSYKDSYSVKDFQQKARALIKDITSRGKLAIVCGGTGLYINSLLYDYKFNDEEVNEEYNLYLDTLSNDELYMMLSKADFEACKSIHINNRKRIIRALLINHSGIKKSDNIKNQTHELQYDAKIIGLTMDREKLYTKINERVDTMFSEGLSNELDILYYDGVFNLQSMQGIGYKEFKYYYSDEITLEIVKEEIKRNTRKFAKRQYTWFNNQMDVEWYDVNTDFNEELENNIEKWLK